MKFIYKYTGYNLRNEVITGTVEGKNKNEAISSIRGVNRLSSCKLHGIQFGRGMNKNKMSMFLAQTSYLLESGIPLHRAMNCLMESGDKDTKATAEKIYIDVSIGKAFSEAFRGLGGNLAERFFPQMEAAEKSASLDKTLKEISIQLKKESKNQSGVKTALLYPCFVLALAIGIAAFLLISVVPDIATILYELGGTLPYLTRVMIGMSDFIAKWGVLVLAALGGAGYLFYKFIHGKGQLWWDGLMLRVPLLGPILRNDGQINFYRALYYMISAGLAFVPALEYSTATVRNKRFRADLESATLRVRQEGIDLATAMSTITYLDPIRLQAIKVGIEANKLQQTLYDTAESLEEINDEAMERFKTMLNPILMIVVGVICGFILFSMYLPMFTVMGNM